VSENLTPRFWVVVNQLLTLTIHSRLDSCVPCFASFMCRRTASGGRPMRYDRVLAAGLFLLGIGGAAPASAAIITYDSASAWASAVSSPSTVTFNGFTGGPVGEGSSYSEGGVGFAVPSSQSIFGVGPSYGYPAGSFYGNGFLFWQCDGGPCTAGSNTLTVTLPSAVDAIGFDYAELSGGTDTYTIVADGQTVTETTSTSGDLFFGLTDTDTFTSFTITDLNTSTSGPDFPSIDNVSYATSLSSASAVPEPASLTLLASALIGFGAVRRRKRT
jgi:hypothetical protein